MTLLLALAWLVQKCFCWEGVAWALLRGWALINFLGFHGGRLFEVGAYSKVGIYWQINTVFYSIIRNSNHFIPKECCYFVTP